MNRKSEKRKSEAEAESVMVQVLKEMQETYQLYVDNTKARTEEDLKYIGVLKEDRRQLLDEREELRKRIDETEEKVRELQREVARNGRMVESLRPFICGVIGCRKRQPVAISVEGEVSDSEPKDIEPIKQEDMV